MSTKLERRKAALKEWVAYVESLSPEKATELLKPIHDRIAELKMRDFIYKIDCFLRENDFSRLKFHVLNNKIQNELRFFSKLDDEYIVEYYDNYLLGDDNIEVHNNSLPKEKETLLKNFSLELFSSFKDEISLLTDNNPYCIVYVNNSGDNDILDYHVYKSETKESFIEKVVCFLNKHDLKEIQFDLLIYSSEREYKNIFFTRNDGLVFKDDFSMPKELKENEDFIEFLEYFCSDITHNFIQGLFNVYVKINNQGNVIETVLPDDYELEPLKRDYNFDNKYFLK